VNAHREEKRMLRVGPVELEREGKRVRVEDVKEVMKAHTEQVKKAMYAGSTPDIDMGEVTTTDMVNTAPMTSSKRTRGTDAHFWISKANTEVRVFWAGATPSRRWPFALFVPKISISNKTHTDCMH
jgi:hypothetical protein